MSTTRRSFIRMGCCAAASMGVAASLEKFGLLNALAQGGSTYKAMVCVFLFGGNDGNNLIVPISTTGTAGFTYNDYLGIRGTAASGGLGLPQAQLLPVAARTAQPSGMRDFGFHPALAQSCLLFQNNHAAVIANMGMLYQPITRSEYRNRTKPVPANLFSHSDQQQAWQTAFANGFGSTGWAGRTADVAHAIHNVGAQFPPILTVAGSAIFCTGVQTHPFAMVPNSSPGLTGYSGSAASNARLLSLQEMLTFDSGVSLVQATSSITGAALAQSAQLSSALQAVTPPTTVFPTTSLGNQLRQVAHIIKARTNLDANLRRQIFFCSQGGYDTHSNQINDQNNLLTTLDAALKSFYDAMVEIGASQNVTAFTLSEFGRTLKTASGAGSDHGWGSHQIVIGDAVQGGDIYGRIPNFALGGPDDSSSNGRWIPSTSLDQFGATLARWFGVPDTDLPAIFPNLANFSTNNLGFML